jgi:hypothetical protein
MALPAAVVCAVVACWAAPAAAVLGRVWYPGSVTSAGPSGSALIVFGNRATAAVIDMTPLAVTSSDDRRGRCAVLTPDCVCYEARPATRSPGHGVLVTATGGRAFVVVPADAPTGLEITVALRLSATADLVPPTHVQRATRQLVQSNHAMRLLAAAGASWRLYPHVWQRVCGVMPGQPSLQGVTFNHTRVTRMAPADWTPLPRHRPPPSNQNHLFVPLGVLVTVALGALVLYETHQ